MALPERTSERYAPLIDLSIRSDTGDGRIIDAYAAVFNTPQEVRDQDGHYMEVLAPNVFDRTISQRADQVQVMFNHGKTIFGTPSERFAMPYGKSISMRADEKGLFTSTQVSKTELGDEILQLVNDGVIKGQSFSGPFLKTSRERASYGKLPTLTRQEAAVREYGLTPFPIYADAHVVGVRSEFEEMLGEFEPEQLAEMLGKLPDSARAELAQALTSAAPGTGDPGPLDPQHATSTRAERQQVLRQLTLEKFNA